MAERGTTSVITALISISDSMRKKNDEEEEEDGCTGGKRGASARGKCKLWG
jgi:hypothetical protein